MKPTICIACVFIFAVFHCFGADAVSTLSQLPVGDVLLIRVDPKGDSRSYPYTFRFSRLPTPTVTVSRIVFLVEENKVREQSKELGTFSLMTPEVGVVDRLIALPGPPEAPLYRTHSSMEATITQFRESKVIASVKRSDQNDTVIKMLIGQLEIFVIKAEHPKEYEQMARQPAKSSNP